MTERKRPPSLEELDARVREARKRRAAAEPARSDEGDRGSALGIAWRIGLELVAAVIVGTAIGWAFDRWLGTRPVGMIVFFFLGVGAGMTNVWRAMTGQGMAIGYRRHDGQQPGSPGKADDED